MLTYTIYIHHVEVTEVTVKVTQCVHSQGTQRTYILIKCFPLDATESYNRAARPTRV